MSLAQEAQARDVGGELHPADGLERRGDLPAHIREGEPDRLGAQVDPDEAPAARGGRDESPNLVFRHET